MAIYYARASGNVNGSIWATTPTGTASNLFPSFTNADTLYANNFTVTLNVNTTVLDVRTDNTNSATAGGQFTLSDGVTLTAAVVAGSTNGCVVYGGSASASIVGSVTGGGGGGFAGAAQTSGTGTLSITGNVVGGTSAGPGVYHAAGNLIITGNVTAGNSTGNGQGVNIQSVGTTTITGTVTGATTGSVTPAGVTISVVGTLNVTGTVVGGNVSPGVSVTGAATVTVTRAKGNGFGSGSSGMTAQPGINNTSQSASVRAYSIEYGDLGMSPTVGTCGIVNDTTNVAVMYRPGSTKKTLIDAAGTVGYPAASNVRSGTTYGNGNFTGTLAVPAAGSVALGVPVDNTTGTAALTPAAVWDYLTSAATTSGSMGERLKDAATVASTGQQLANALTP